MDGEQHPKLGETSQPKFTRTPDHAGRLDRVEDTLKALEGEITTLHEQVRGAHAHISDILTLLDNVFERLEPTPAPASENVAKLDPFRTPVRRPGNGGERREIAHTTALVDGQDASKEERRNNVLGGFMRHARLSLGSTRSRKPRL